MNTLTSKFEALWQRNAPLLRLLLLGFLILLLQIPVAMIHSQITERGMTRDQAAREIQQQWGGDQVVVGPRVVVPYTYRWVDWNEKTNEKIERRTIRYASFLPSELNVNGRLNAEHRYRGVYEVPVYGATLHLTGHFSKPDLSTLGIDPLEVHWQEAQLVVHVSDTRAIQNLVTLKWNGDNLAFQPGTGLLMTDPNTHTQSYSPYNGIHAQLNDTFDSERFDFSIELAINGSGSLHLVPVGDNSEVKLSSNWPNPGFQGAWLPRQRAVTETGFDAVWQVPFLSRSMPNQWKHSVDFERQLQEGTLGVDLVTMVDNYRMADRSIKYQMLFLMLTFLSLWLVEVLTRIRIHPVQYLLVGASLCLFYLLHLSLSEHLGFVWAYLLAATLVIGQIGAYMKVMLKHNRHVAAIGAVLIMLYSYLYVLLQEQEFALLGGSLGLFAALGVVMFVTRRVDWGNLNVDRAAGKE